MPEKDHTITFSYATYAPWYSATGNVDYTQRTPAKTSTSTLTYKIKNPCHENPHNTLTATTQSGTTLDATFDGVVTTFTYTPYTQTYDYCTSTVTCKSVVGARGLVPLANGLQCSDFAINASTNIMAVSFDLTKYQSNNYDPGDYVITYEVVVDGSTAPEHKKQFTITLKLNDPCHDYTLSIPTFTNQVYTIGDAAPALLTFATDFSR